MTAEQHIVYDLARTTGQRIARDVRVSLQRMTEARLSGDDSPLKNTWDELCVQLQSEKSFYWTVYELTIETIVQGCVETLPRHELEALWFQTEAYAELERQGAEDPQNSGKRPAVCYEEVTDYIIDHYVYPLAGDWSNPKIRSFLDSLSATD